MKRWLRPPYPVQSALLLVLATACTLAQPQLPELALDQLTGGLVRPVVVTHAGDGSGRLFVVEQPGRIRIVTNGSLVPTPFLDLGAVVNNRGNEQGLLGLAFHPEFATNGRFFVDYTAGDGSTVVAEYRVSADPDLAETDGTELLRIRQPESNHNGGQLAFGPDGHLYVGVGDGGGGGDRHGAIGNGQDRSNLLGAVLRLDVSTPGVARAPADNPFVGVADAADEIWGYGLRNPWRFSFDRASGDLYIADVGQREIEEVSVQPASSAGGENYGWRLMEGDACFNPSSDCNDGSLVLPVITYPHSEGCSITGGYVYRGAAIPALQGHYLYGDYCQGWVRAASETTGDWSSQTVLEAGFNISTFGEDEDGEVYLVDHGRGLLYRIVAK